MKRLTKLKNLLEKSKIEGNQLFKRNKIIFAAALWIASLTGLPTKSRALGASYYRSQVPLGQIERNLHNDLLIKDFLRSVNIVDRDNGQKVILTNNQIDQIDYLANGLLSGSLNVNQAISQLRGGDGWFDVITFVVLGLVIHYLSPETTSGVEAWIPHHNPLAFINKGYRPPVPPTGPIGPGPSSSREMHKPGGIPQQEYSNLSRSERRQLADPLGRDAFLQREGFPRLELRYNQIDYKTPKHGDLHGAPIDDNGKVAKTEANAIIVRDSLVAMGENPDCDWYHGYYQAGNTREVKAINLKNRKDDIIAVYSLQPDGGYNFLTTCEMSEMEADHFSATMGNFTTEKVLKNQKTLINPASGKSGTTNNN